MADTTLAQNAQQNGSGEGAESALQGEGKRRGGIRGGLLGRAASALRDGVAARLRADLDDRDPDYIREKLPLLWLVSSIWFRGEVRNLGNIPEDRPVLLVGNHSGGTVTPDTLILTLAFSSYFGVERRFFQLAHNLVLASPYGQFLRRFGTVTASHQNAETALRSGAAVLVYPGGDWEVHRPVWQRNRIDFAGRTGYVRLALDANVPIVPVVSIGGHETALFLSQGGAIARALRLDELFRLKVVPISIALPWLLNVGDLLGHIPLPAKITIEVLPPIDLRSQFGDQPDPAEVDRYLRRQMQDALDALAAERRLPVIG